MTAYRFLIIIFSPLILVHLLWKALQLKQSRFLYERLGFGISHISQHCVWLHCASVGEVNAALPLVYALREQQPEQQFLITTNTTTGAEIVARQQQTWLCHAYLPMDWVSSTQRFFKKTRPRALFIMETELWPNLVDCFHQHNVPVCIINGRLSKKTVEANAWVRSVYKLTLQCINHIYVRSEIDHALYLTLGASNDQLTTLGNMKFSSKKSAENNRQQLTKREYVVVASSHENEEQQICERWLKLNRNELLVIAPRHPNRSAHILTQLSSMCQRIAVRSRNDAITGQTQIYLLDTVGELTDWLSDAKVIIMAGSFTHRGGHNILEPAHYGKAILCGPHMESFVDETQILLSHHALLQVASMDELETQLAELLDNDEARSHLENNAVSAVAPFEHIIDDYASALQTYINN